MNDPMQSQPDPALDYPALADDIRRYNDHLPIEARPVSTFYQLQKFARRNKALVGGTVATLLVAIVGALVATSFALEASRHARAMERTSYVSGISAAASALAARVSPGVLVASCCSA